MSLKIAARTAVRSFNVASLFFYETALGSKELENGREWALLEMTRLVESVPARQLLN